MIIAEPLTLVFWQAALTEHQIHLLRALAKTAGVSVNVVVGEVEHTERKRQGWVAPRHDDLTVIVLDSVRWWAHGRSLLKMFSSATHIFSGFWGDRRFFSLILYAAWRVNAATAIMTEPYADVAHGYFQNETKFYGWIKRMLRPSVYRAASVILRRRVRPIFAISDLALSQNLNNGFAVADVFPFGYFVPRRSCDLSPWANTGPLRLVYVGSFITRKGADLVAQAVQRCLDAHIDVTLDIYGPGERPDWLADMPAAIRYRGHITFGESQCVIGGYDAIVVPSRYDGWGVVVNEALLQGVPAIVSNRAGASALVRYSGAGVVFDPATEDLANVIANAAHDRELIATWRARAKYYRASLEPALAAKYFLDCLATHRSGKTKPTPPWVGATTAPGTVL